MTNDNEVTWRVIADFDGFCIDSKVPEGYERRFRKHERIQGERKDVGGGLATIAGLNLAIFGVPTTAITTDGRARTGRVGTMV